MKKIGLGILVTVVILSLSGVAIAISNQGAEKTKAPDLEKVEFIHWKKGFAKPETAKAPKPPTCYKFLTPTKVRWSTLPVSYLINPTNPQGLTESFVASAVSNSAEIWDTATGKELMNDSYAVDYAAAYGVQDYKNSISFGNYSTVGVIGVTTAWYNPAQKRDIFNQINIVNIFGDIIDAS